MSLAELLSAAFSNVTGYEMPFVVFSVLSAVVVILLFAMPVGGICTYLERKISADFQERVGPNRVGPIGLLQFFADGIKMFLKEDIANKNADILIYNIAPALVMAGSLGAFAAIPFAKYVIGANLDIGVFYVMAIGSLVSLGILLGAWSSDNKWSLLGGCSRCCSNCFLRNSPWYCGSFCCLGSGFNEPCGNSRYASLA